MKKAKSKPALTARERLLLLVLPGALVLALYAMFVNNQHSQALRKATLERDKLSAQVGAMRVQPQTLAADLQRMKKELADLKRELAAFSEGGSDAAQRSETVVMVGGLLRQHGMIIVEEGPSARQAHVAPTASRSTAKRQVVPSHADAVWQVRFLGSWSEVQAALEALPGLTSSAYLPLSLSMAEPSTSSPVREWILRLRL
jgi:hypothetical protein